MEIKWATNRIILMDCGAAEIHWITHFVLQM